MELVTSCVNNSDIKETHLSENSSETTPVAANAALHACVIIALYATTKVNGSKGTDDEKRRCPRLILDIT